MFPNRERGEREREGEKGMGQGTDPNQKIRNHNRFRLLNHNVS